MEITHKDKKILISPDHIKKNIKKTYPKGISKHCNKYRIVIPLNKMRKYIDTSYDLDYAIKILNDYNITKNNNKLLIQEFKIKFNKIKNDDGNYIYIIKNNTIIIDKETYKLMYKHTWYVDQNYVKTGNKLLSRMVMNCNENDNNLVVDHINGNTLDNRKCNLRQITQSQNTLNRSSKKSSSKYIGVYYHKITKKWAATISIDGKSIYLGIFDREQDAALARDYATKKYYKGFGRLNFLERPGWDEYIMNICEAVKLRSQDYYKVGSVLVSVKNNRIISTGYNSIAPNLNDNEINWSQRDLISDIVIHAEMNVLLYCESKFEESILYTTSSPCVSCLKMLSASKIKKIIYKHEYKDIDKVKKLAEFFKIELIEYENIR